MTIQQMMYYEAVARHQSITRAAAELHIAQPTLSLAMQALESETGLNLFRHVGRNIELTVDGQALFAEVTQMLKHVARFDSRVAELARRHQDLRFAVPMFVGTILLPLVLGKFRATHPEIRLEIVETTGVDALDLVEREEADVAVVHDGEHRHGLTVRRLPDWPFCLCVRRDHPLAARTHVPFAEAIAEPLVLLDRGSLITRRLAELCAHDHLTPHILHYTPHLSTIWNVVTHGIACGLLAGGAILPDSALVAIPIDGLVQHPAIFTKTGRQVTQDQRTLIAFLKREFPAAPVAKTMESSYNRSRTTLKGGAPS
ncbi:LysR family transcriptional regulator [uncultured Selenomonas sp.]|uniref:LysR family transcriptional regulator n=1 Tax=uncultured Selenomonas sp. TaxID=159275 RepID=UPI0025F6083E|nr:LysR family transcriptional regulator [uncultured Selenomonas sp.]